MAFSGLSTMTDVNHLDGELVDYKRVCQKQPPHKFTVELLPPTKYGSSILFGMRISAVTNDYESQRSSRASTYSLKEYDVWRSWDDWIWLQVFLEEEYNLLAREKKNRLLAGKGVKKDGFYKQDAASSWDSLPPGPDPNSVAQRFHDLVPLLSKRGTVFRATQSTIDQRFIEIKSFIEAFFKEDQPTLIADLRVDRRVTDFFGIWKRDVDLERKQSKVKPPKRTSEPISTPRASISSSVFSMYFENASMPSVDSQSPSSKSRKFSFSSAITPYAEATSARSSVVSGSVVSTIGRPTLKLDIPVIINPRREPNRRSSTSSDSSSGSSPRSSTSSRLSLTSVVDDHPTPFGYNPQLSTSHSALSVLPEDEVLSSKNGGNHLMVPNSRTTGTSRRARRSAQLFDNPELVNGMQYLDLDGHRNSNRDSWQSNMSGASAAMADLGFTLPTTPTRSSSRMSVSSVATYMTDTSVDAVLPQERPRVRGEAGGKHSHSVEDHDGLDGYYFSDLPRPVSTESRARISQGSYRPSSTMSLNTADFIMDGDEDSYGGYGSDDTLDVPMTARPARPPSPTMSVRTISSIRSSTTASSSGFSAFSTATLSSVSSIMSSPSFVSEDKKPISPTAPVTVKAAFDKTIVMFRATRDIPLHDARQRVKDKFAMQKLILSPRFTIALAMQESMRSRNSVVSLASEGDLKIITNPEEWRWVMNYVDHSKITIRIFDD